MSLPTPTDAGVNTIEQAVQGLGSLANLVFPGSQALIAMAVVLAKFAPHAYVDVMLLLAKKEPTQDEKDAVSKKINTLLHPEDLYADAAPPVPAPTLPAGAVEPALP